MVSNTIQCGFESHPGHRSGTVGGRREPVLVGTTRGPRHDPDCWRCTGGDPAEPGSYVRLLGYYLGDGCLSVAGRVYSLRVSCDLRCSGIIADVGAVTDAVRTGRSVGHVPAPGVTVVQAYWRHWPCVFPQHGLGRKHERHLGMETWQRRLVDA